MFIEFTIVKNSNQSLTPLGLHLYKTLETNLAVWAEINKIPYTKKLYKNVFRVAFDNDRHYTVFRLTWKDMPHIEYRLIDRTW